MGENETGRVEREVEESSRRLRYLSGMSRGFGGSLRGSEGRWRGFGGRVRWSEIG